MSLDSLFQHIIFTEHQAEESRRLSHEVRVEISRCREKIQKITEELKGEKMKSECKSHQFSEKAFLLELLKIHENGLEKQYAEIKNERTRLLQTFETMKKKIKEEEERFIKEITGFNNEYGLINKRELLIKEKVKLEISDLEKQENILKSEMKTMEHKSVQLNELQHQKNELIQELFTLQRKLKVIENNVNEARHTTKLLEEEKVRISEKPQNDPECKRLKKELELYKEEDIESVYEALRSEIEFLELMLSQKSLQAK
ncbi:coiled-coil domain-containing protein 172 [Gracilinanus agilis]|uniref:coiled-coil domain-containing protein 172 n=1 Tax=Gracilinanus agilis TaxID=191870 RepID=UPI001CFD66EE|nr:coiled-coil domain-containing protein 172 [Gracilinanus agilis]